VHDRSGLLNTYGPTEATVVATRSRRISSWASEGQLSGMTIGRAIPNVEVGITTDRGIAAPVGVGGFLHIAKRVLRGAIWIGHPLPPRDSEVGSGSRPGRVPTTQAMSSGGWPTVRSSSLAVPISKSSSGDFALSWERIEAAIGAHPGVRGVAVLARDVGATDKQIVAYVVAAGPVHLTSDELHRYLREHLPGYMVPSAYVFLDTLPLTSSGKVDRKALPAPVGRGHAAAGHGEPPRTSTEQTLAKIMV